MTTKADERFFAALPKNPPVLEAERVVPMASTLRVVHEATVDRDGVDKAFFDWYFADRSRLVGGQVFDAIGMSTSHLHRYLDPADEAFCPQTPAGLAWTVKARELLDLTQTDVLRPYDTLATTSTDYPIKAVIPEEVAALYSALDRIADHLDDVSVLLEPVAWAVRVQAETSTVSLGELQTLRDRISVRHIDLETDPEKESTEGSQSLLPWSQVEALAPGTKARVCTTMLYLRRATPKFETTDDRGASRGVTARD